MYEDDLCNDEGFQQFPCGGLEGRVPLQQGLFFEGKGYLMEGTFQHDFPTLVSNSTVADALEDSCLSNFKVWRGLSLMWIILPQSIGCLKKLTSNGVGKQIVMKLRWLAPLFESCSGIPPD